MQLNHVQIEILSFPTGKTTVQGVEKGLAIRNLAQGIYEGANANTTVRIL